MRDRSIWWYRAFIIFALALNSLIAESSERPLRFYRHGFNQNEIIQLRQAYGEALTHAQNCQALRSWPQLTEDLADIILSGHIHLIKEADDPESLGECGYTLFGGFLSFNRVHVRNMAFVPHAGCGPLWSTILHELIHVARMSASEDDVMHLEYACRREAQAQQRSEAVAFL